MQTLLKEPAACVDDALEACRGTAVGWDSISDYMYGTEAPGAKHLADPGVVLRRVLPLPNAFTSQYNSIKYKSFMGLFPEINRAWLTVDSRLFLWGYSARSFVDTEYSNDVLKLSAPSPHTFDDFYAYEGMDQIIVSVGLVHPRKGVFVDEVEYLLAVATSVEVTLLGVTFTGPNRTGEICLVPTQISVATDDVLMLKISSTPDGRIFMAGADGSLHEFVYQTEQKSWMMGLLQSRPKKRARKVIHNSNSIAQYLFPASITSYFSRGDELVDLVIDPKRNALYTLSQGGTLSVYDISEPTIRIVRSVNVFHESRNKVSLMIPAKEREYVSIFPVFPELSSTVHLVVVTSFGERIYFSTAPSSSGSHISLPGSLSNDKVARPKSLNCVGYRPSPEQSMNGDSKPCIHMAWWSHGALVLADLRDRNSDRLVSIFPDASVPRRGVAGQPGTSLRSIELVFEISASATAQSCLDGAGTQRIGPEPARCFTDEPVPLESGQIPTRAFAIADVQEVSSNSASDLEYYSKKPTNPPNYFWVLTASAIHLYERIKPINRLHDILSAGGGSDSEIRAFFARHGEGEACAMCLKIAVTQPALSAAAARVFYTYGGDPTVLQRESKQNGHVQPLYSGVGAPHMDQGRLPASQVTAPSEGAAANGVQQRDVPVNGSFEVGQAVRQSTPLNRFSGSHDGVSLYIAQMVYPMWNEFLTSSRDAAGYQALVASKDLLIDIRERLLALVLFLDRYSPDVMLPSLPDPDNLGTGTSLASHASLVGQKKTEHSGIPQGGLLRRSSVRGISHAANVDDGDSQNQLFRGLFQLKRTPEARKAESESIQGLKKLAIRCAEALALLLVLSDHQLHRLVPTMSQENQDLFVKMRLCDLVVAEVGIVVSAALLEALFRSYTDSASAVASVGRILQERCKGYFSESDSAMHRGIALLRQAVSMIDDVHAGEGLANGFTGIHNAQSALADASADFLSNRNAAVSLAEEASQILKTAPERLYDLPSVCRDFVKVGAIPVLIDLLLTVGSQAEDNRNGERAKSAYSNILDALAPLIHGSSADDSMANGEEIEDERRIQLSEADAKRLKDASVQVAFTSSSDMFYGMFYEFLLRSKAGEHELLQHPSPSLEQFLEARKDRNLLWRYYARHGRHVEAAAILLALAEDDAEIQLVDRLNYLSCALHNAKAATSAGDARAESLLNDISDYMDVAKVQLRVRDELTQLHGDAPEVREALKQLSGQIMDLTTLFNSFAVPFELIEASIEAFRCGSYRDDAYIRSLWFKLVQREGARVSQSPSLMYQKMVSVGKDFFPSELVFPVEYIVDLLEHYIYENRNFLGWHSETGWVSRLMKEIGVPATKIVDAYRNMIESPMQRVGVTQVSWSWSDEDSQLHLMRSTERALAAWVENTLTERVQHSADIHRRTLLSESEKVLRAISLCKSRLRGMSGSAPIALVQRFEALERNISPVT